jgi:hypothetical protein
MLRLLFAVYTALLSIVQACCPSGNLGVLHMMFSRRFFLRVGSVTGIGLAMRAVIGYGKGYAEEPDALSTPSPTATCTPLATAVPTSTDHPLNWVIYAGLSTFDALCPYLGQLSDNDQGDEGDSSHWGNDDPNKVLTKRILEHVVLRLKRVPPDNNHYDEAAKILRRIERLLQRVVVGKRACRSVNSCAPDGEAEVLCHMQNIDSLVEGIYSDLLQESPTPTPTSSATPSACPTTGSQDATIVCLSKNVVVVTRNIAAALPGHFKISMVTGSKS